MLIKFNEDNFPTNVFEDTNIISNVDGVINVQVIGTSSELDQLTESVNVNEPIEIVRSGVLGISSNKNILSIHS